MSRSPRQWWAASGAVARWTTLGGSALVLALAVTTSVVWSSPGIGAAPASAEDRLAEALRENAELRADLATAHERSATPSATPTPTPTLSPAPTPEAPPAPPPADPAEPDAGERPAPERDTIVVTRTVRVPAEVQPRPPAPAPAPVPAAPVTAPSKAELLEPEKRYFGMYTTQAPFSFATFDDVAFKLDARQSMVGYVGGWDQAYRGDAVTRSWERGLLPMLTWESRPIGAQNDVSVDPEFTLSRIIGGAHDDYLRTYARDIVSTGLPLAIRLDHEMNGSWYPWSEMRDDGSSLNTNERGQFVEMWRHVHDIFQAEGAGDLVIWVWAPNIVNNLAPVLKDPAYLASLYPGDEYVDWVGLSGYLRPSNNEANRSFEFTFAESLRQLRNIADKPIILAETGATEIGGRKAEWVRTFFEAFTSPENADLVGFAWFNLTITTISGGERVTNDFRVDSRADSLEAFRVGVTNPAADFAFTPY